MASILRASVRAASCPARLPSLARSGSDGQIQASSSMDALAATFMTMAVPQVAAPEEGSYPGLSEGSYPGLSPVGSAISDYDDNYDAPMWRSVQALPAAAPEALLMAAPMQSGFTTVHHAPPLAHYHMAHDYSLAKSPLLVAHSPPFPCRWTRAKWTASARPSLGSLSSKRAAASASTHPPGTRTNC